MITVLVVDDSAVIRTIVCSLLAKHHGIQTITASNGKEALDAIEKHNPAIVTLDIEMPVMNGLATLEVIMERFPRPVIMMSALTHQGTEETVEALRLGAVDCIPKVSSEVLYFKYIEEELLARIRYFAKGATFPIPSLPNNTNSNFVKPKEKITLFLEKLIVIGCSTGGPMVLQNILPLLPARLKGTIVIAQHMPEAFTESFVGRLQKICSLNVEVAHNDSVLQLGTVYICYGGMQTTIRQHNGEYLFYVREDNTQASYKPSVDGLFSSVAKLPYLYSITTGIVLTGMGKDGLEGAKELHSKNVPILAQDKESSVVYGMPKSVMEEGVAQEVALSEIPKRITQLCGIEGTANE